MSGDSSTPLVPPSPPSTHPAALAVSSAPSDAPGEAGSELDLLALDPKAERIVPAQRRERPWLWHQPQKGALIVAWMTSCILLAPYWAIAALFGQRPRRTWSVKRCVQVRFIRRVVRVSLSRTAG